MAKPITWRNIAAPSFTTGFGANANAAFSSAGQGFSRASDMLLGLQETADQQYTNQAIAEALRTGQAPNQLNPRANAASVYDALLGKQKAESDLESARVGRGLTEAQTKETSENAARLALNNAPEWRDLEKREKEAQIKRWEALSDNERAQLGLTREKLDMLKKANKREEDIRAASLLIDTQIDAQAARAAEQSPALSNYGQNVADTIKSLVERGQVAGKTPQQIQAAIKSKLAPVLKTEAEGIALAVPAEARAEIINRLAAQGNPGAPYGLTRDEFLANTGAGADVTTARELLQGQAAASLEREAKRQEYEGETRTNAADGYNLHGMILDPETNTYRPAANDGELRGNHFSKESQSIDAFRKGYSEDKLSDDVIKEVHRTLGGNKSVIRALANLKGLTETGLRDAANLHAADMQKAARDQHVESLQPTPTSTAADLVAKSFTRAEDEQFLLENPPGAVPNEDDISYTDNPQIKVAARSALQELAQLRKNRPDMSTRQRRILDRWEDIFRWGRVISTNPAFTSRDMTTVYDDERVQKELDEWNQYQTRNKYK